MNFTYIASLWMLLLMALDFSLRVQAQSRYYGNDFPFRHIKNRNRGPSSGYYPDGSSDRVSRRNGGYGGYYPRKYEDDYYNGYGDRSGYRRYEDDYLESGYQGRYNGHRGSYNSRRGRYNNDYDTEYYRNRRTAVNVGVHHG